MGLNWLNLRAYICRFGNQMTIHINHKFDKFFTWEYLSRLRRILHTNHGWQCVHNEMCVGVNSVNKSVIV